MSFLTAKQIGKRIKAKGLGRLKWYCQMCQKQCRDENGFKCHTTSEAHLRQMELFAQNPEHYLESLSREFEEAFLKLLSRRFNTKRVEANRVYNEFVQDKDHTHMNSTKWESLSGFIQYLGREGKVRVEENDKGLYIQWVDRDPEALARQARQLKKEKADQDDTALSQRLMERRAAAMRAEALRRGVDVEAAAQPTARLDDGKSDVRIEAGGGRGAGDSSGVGKKGARRRAHGVGGRATLRFDEAPATSAAEDGPPAAKRPRFGEAAETAAVPAAAVAAAAAASAGSPGTAASASTATTAATTTAPTTGTPHMWLCESLMVKITNKQVGDGRYYKKKARVLRVDQDNLTADVREATTGHKLRIHQSDLQTVVPKPGLPDGGSRVMLLAGELRGLTGNLVELHLDQYCADVQLDDGTERVATGVEYEDLCLFVPAGDGSKKDKKKKKEKKNKKDKKKKHKKDKR